MNKKILSFLFIFSYLSILTTQAQVTPGDDLIGRDGSKVITTTVPFLLIAPDSRAGGMGDAGVATTPDVNSMHWNAAKYAFIGNDVGVSLSYSPWLRKLVKDMNLLYLSAYKKLNDENVFSASLLYFDLGSIEIRTEQNVLEGNFSPNEFAIDFGYTRLLGRHFSGAVALRYINSNLTGGQNIGDTETKTGRTVAGDVSFYYHNDNINTGSIPSTIMWGVNISNIGGKISYTTNKFRDFIPANFRTGVGYLLSLDNHNEIMFTCDFNKLLVPTPPIYENGDIVAGKDPNIPSAGAIFTSWFDAPGFVKNGKRSVIREELAEFTTSLGFEYWYDKQFALRLGYFNENVNKGNRKFFTFGAGLKMNIFGLDFSYLLPVTQSNPLENTLRFTLTFDIGGLSNESRNNSSRF